METLSGWLQFEMFSVDDYRWTLCRQLSCVLILLATWITSRLVGKGLVRVARCRSRLSRSQIYSFTRLPPCVIVAIGLMAALCSRGITSDKPVLIAGALVKRPGNLVPRFNLDIHQALTSNEIEAPFPQRDLHIGSSYRQLLPAEEKPAVAQLAG